MQQLQQLTNDGGYCVLETLIVDDDSPLCNQRGIFVPDGRYAQMRNVWSIYSVSALQQALSDSGFRQVRCIDINTTSEQEQRSTAWMRFNSLADFLDPSNRALTVEGHPRPKRALLIAKK